MRGHRWRLGAIIVAAAVIGAIVVMPAVGGPSLRKLVRKEVTKQLKRKTGPVGPVGPAGAPGAPGTNGVTFGSNERTTSFGELADTPSVIESEENPAGDYLVWAEIDLRNDAADGDVDCTLSLRFLPFPGDVTLDSSGIRDIPTGPATLTMHTAASILAETNEIWLQCTDLGTTVEVDRVELSMIRIDNLEFVP